MGCLARARKAPARCLVKGAVIEPRMPWSHEGRVATLRNGKAGSHWQNVGASLGRSDRTPVDKEVTRAGCDTAQREGRVPLAKRGRLVRAKGSNPREQRGQEGPVATLPNGKAGSHWQNVGASSRRGRIPNAVAEEVTTRVVQQMKLA